MGIETESRWTDVYFNQKFEELIKKQDITYVQAYVIIEELHVKEFGKVRYASYDSFRICRKKLIFGH